MESTDFQQELSALINKHSIEDESNTPDYILAQYIRKVLSAYNECIISRDEWYGFNPF